ncbi:MAG: peroxidase [SAR324 cluster bacterium]|nr:peroxidase [SAR324 cluster bacterium]
MSAQRQDALLESLKGDYRRASLESADLAMLKYSKKLTVTPGLMNRDDVESLRIQGFDDRAIHDICSVVAYFAFVNRIADGLGVQLEELHS